MSVFKGKNITLEIYGESHAERIGVSAAGFPEMPVNVEELSAFLSRRSGGKKYSTSRKEQDIPVFSGLKDGKICGEFTAEFFNQDIKKSDYESLYAKPRPSHADFVRFVKEGTLDFAGGGRFSGRMTAPFCVAGGLAVQYLRRLSVHISAYVSSVGTVKGKSYREGGMDAFKAATLRDSGEFPSLDHKEEMLSCIEECKKAGDSVGGVVECIVSGLAAGVGNDLFEGLESKISSLVFAIPAVKGVQFGDGFSLSERYGSAANDELQAENGKIKLRTNRAGGINGGVSNGEDLTLSVAFRPTPSIAKPQKTVDLLTGENITISISGRHDPCIAPRAAVCVESAVALALLDEIL